jgi:hypothetical protein
MSSDIGVLLHTSFPAGMQFWLFLAMFAPFAVKLPMWPVHLAGRTPTSRHRPPARSGGRAAEDGGVRVPALLGRDVARCVRNATMQRLPAELSIVQLIACSGIRWGASPTSLAIRSVAGSGNEALVGSGTGLQ